MNKKVIKFNILNYYDKMTRGSVHKANLIISHASRLVLFNK